MPDKPSPEEPVPFITKEFRKDVLSNLWMSPKLDLEAAIGRLIASAKAATENDKKDGKDGAADGAIGVRLDRNIIGDGNDGSDGDDGTVDDGNDSDDGNDQGTGKEATDDTGKETSDGTGKESTDDTGKEASEDTGKETTDDTGAETSHAKTFEEDVGDIHRLLNDPDFNRSLKNFRDKVLNAKDTLDGVLEGTSRQEFDESENETPSASSLDQQKLDDLERQFDVRLKELMRTKRPII
jgi:hypothetical protein